MNNQKTGEFTINHSIADLEAGRDYEMVLRDENVLDDFVDPGVMLENAELNFSLERKLNKEKIKQKQMWDRQRTGYLDQDIHEGQLLAKYDDLNEIYNKKRVQFKVGEDGTVTETRQGQEDEESRLKSQGFHKVNMAEKRSLHKGGYEFERYDPEFDKKVISDFKKPDGKVKGKLKQRLLSKRKREDDGRQDPEDHSNLFVDVLQSEIETNET